MKGFFLSVPLSKTAQKKTFAQKSMWSVTTCTYLANLFFIFCREKNKKIKKRWSQKGGLIYSDYWKPHLDYLSPEPDKSQLGQKVPWNVLAAK